MGKVGMTISIFMRIAARMSILILILCACSEEIDLVSEGEAIPVVYAIFDASDSIHTVRLSKSFADEMSVESMINNPAYLYYDQARITMNKKNSTKKYTFLLNESIPRQQGYFPDSPNPVYQLEQKLDPGLYTLNIDTGDGTSPININTHLISDLIVAYPGKASKRIYFYDDPVLFIWLPSSDAYSYEIAFTLIYEEKHQSNKLQRKSVTYSRRVFKEELEWMQDRYKAHIYSDPVYSYFGLQIHEDDMVEYRKPIELILTISSADQDLTRYLRNVSPDIDTRNAANGNLENAIGIVASKFSCKFPNMQLASKAMDSLRSGRFTKDLKFVNNSDW